MNLKKNTNKKAFGFVSAAIVVTLFFCATAAVGQDLPKSNASTTECASDLPFMLLQIQADVQGSLNDLEADVANASENLSITGLEGTAARKVLLNLLEINPNLAEALTFNKEGKIVLTECKGCESGKDANMSSKDQISIHSPEKLSQSANEIINHVLKKKTPAFSKVFRTLEGVNGTGFAYPVFSPQGYLIGGVGITIEPDKMLNAMVAPQLHFNTSTRGNITDYSFWMLHLDGLVAYDRDASQVGKDLFKDPIYRPFPSLLDLGKRIIAERSGHGNYSFQVTEGNKKVVTKDTYWTTASLYGREWRLVITKIMQ
jgi:polar amino acid transport system substrate-binding protein